MSKIQPLADRVLVKAAAAEEKTVGGIIIPDHILFGKWSGSDFEFEGEKYQMMKQSDIWAVIK